MPLLRPWMEKKVGLDISQTSFSQVSEYSSSKYNQLLFLNCCCYFRSSVTITVVAVLLALLSIMLALLFLRVALDTLVCFMGCYCSDRSVLLSGNNGEIMSDTDLEKSTALDEDVV